MSQGQELPDGTVVCAHQHHAAGAVGGQQHEALGRSRGFSTKIHVRADAGRKALVFVLSGGERHESRYLEALLNGGRVRRAGRGRPRVRPRELVADSGYSYPAVRRLLAERGVRAVIPRRQDQHPDDRRHLPFDRGIFREWIRVERLVG
jgi:hypothetical protein